MKNSLYILLLVATLLSSCSEFQKVLKSEDIAKKFKLGTELYEKGKFEKANRLFAQIVPNYRGKPQAAKLMYMYSNTFYENEEYVTANYQFERFTNAYSNDVRVEEAAFKAAKSYYFLSPAYSKDATDTKTALEKLQLFANVYPNSKYLTEVNTLVSELDGKLERKAYDIAKQYHRIGPALGTFSASIKSFTTFLADFPGATRKEEALYYRFDAAYQLAVKSVEYKKLERLLDAKKYYEAYKTAAKNEKLIKKADEKSELLTSLINDYNSKS